MRAPREKEEAAPVGGNGCRQDTGGLGGILAGATGNEPGRNNCTPGTGSDDTSDRRTRSGAWIDHPAVRDRTRASAVSELSTGASAAVALGVVSGGARSSTASVVRPRPPADETRGHR